VSDVWKELEERLKQEALSGVDLAMKGYTSLYQPYTKWVKLEDAKKELQQLKQNYVLVKIGDLEAIVYTSTKYESLRDVVDDFCGNYDDVAREAYALGMKDLAKRLLKE